MTLSTEEILVIEIEKLLDQVAPTEADLAASYVIDQQQYARHDSGERKFGIPGAGLVALAGPILLHFVVVIAMDIFSAARKKGAEVIADQLWKYLSSKVRPNLPKPEGRAQTIDVIKSTLTAAGWDEKRAAEAANLAWASGVETGQRFSKLLN